MATFQRKQRTVEAVVYEADMPLRVVSHEKGEQTANKGDYLIGNERGKITVVSEEAFLADYEPLTSQPDPIPSKPANKGRSATPRG